MRNITLAAKGAFDAKQQFSSGNTVVRIGETWVRLYLHGNLIAARDKITGRTYFTMAGWSSSVTRERLQAAGVRISQKDFEQYLDGKRIDTRKWYHADGGREISDEMVNDIEG